MTVGEGGGGGGGDGKRMEATVVVKISLRGPTPPPPPLLPSPPSPQWFSGKEPASGAGDVGITRCFSLPSRIREHVITVGRKRVCVCWGMGGGGGGEGGGVDHFSWSSDKEPTSRAGNVGFVCWLVGCLTSQQHASVSQ